MVGLWGAYPASLIIVISPHNQMLMRFEARWCVVVMWHYWWQPALSFPVMNVTLQGLGPSTSTWSKMGLGWAPYYGQDSPGFNHFPKGLHRHSSVGTGISDRSGEKIYECVPYKNTH